MCCRWWSGSWNSGENTIAVTQNGVAALGVADDGELAAAIRAGTLDVEPDELRRVLREMTLDKLTVANPRYVG